MQSYTYIAKYSMYTICDMCKLGSDFYAANACMRVCMRASNLARMFTLPLLACMHVCSTTPHCVRLRSGAMQWARLSSVIFLLRRVHLQLHRQELCMHAYVHVHVYVYVHVCVKDCMCVYIWICKCIYVRP